MGRGYRPCLNCERREINCHDGCPEFKLFRQLLEAGKPNYKDIQNNRNFTEFKNEVMTRIMKKRRG